MKKKNIAIIGAGPGGLTAGMLLSAKGHRVTLYEKKSDVGGRNGEFLLDGGYAFDIGPTFLMLKYILDEVFEKAGEDINEYLEFIRLDPMYRLSWPNKHLDTTEDHERMKTEIDRVFPGQSGGLDIYKEKEQKRFEKLMPCLGRDYASIQQYFNSPDLYKAIPYLSVGRSVFDVLGDYFTDDELKIAFTFQAKYLGMSPWKCPGLFTMLSYSEHAHGIYHVKGGLNKISHAMREVIEKNGGSFVFDAEVEKINMQQGEAQSFVVNGEQVNGFDEVVINADFGHVADNLFDDADLPKKYTSAALPALKYSCSTYMVYLGLDTVYEDEPFHHIVLADDYKKNITAIAHEESVDDNFSVYIRNASVLDDTLAPEGHSGLYLLVPVSNLNSGVDWEQKRELFYEEVLDFVEKRTGMTDIREHIVTKKIFSPLDWQSENIYQGVTFNLAHSLDQMLSFRPKNRMDGMKNVYLVGGGTHPGSGLPTIYESGRIASEMIG